VPGIQNVFQDLAAESEEIDRMVAGLDASQWNLDTPAEGWTIAHQVAHLSFIFHLAGTAAAAPETFKALIASAADDFSGAVNAALGLYLPSAPEDLLARWRKERAESIAALTAVPPDQVVPWLVRPLPPTILACAGIMETFAHGQDIADALGVRRTPTDRLELTAPSGALWEFGPEDATQKIIGPAADFCLLVTRRRHRHDLALTAVGAEADQWLDIAQAYRGPSGSGRTARQFAHIEATA
jgi:enediyne biosynthesis protein E11